MYTIIGLLQLMRLDKYSKGIQRRKTFITLAILFVVIKIDTCTAGGRNHTHTHGETHMYMHTRTHTHTHTRKFKS